MAIRVTIVAFIDSYPTPKMNRGILGEGHGREDGAQPMFALVYMVTKTSGSNRGDRDFLAKEHRGGQDDINGEGPLNGYMKSIQELKVNTFGVSRGRFRASRLERERHINAEMEKYEGSCLARIGPQDFST